MAGTIKRRYVDIVVRHGGCVSMPRAASSRLANADPHRVPDAAGSSRSGG
jgi:hypothetical protein